MLKRTINTHNKKKVKLKRNSVKDLAAASADYNPRQISDKRLKELGGSYETFGDLSGVVLNVATNTLVSGHQRIKTMTGKKTRIVKEAHVDNCGTVAIGNIEILQQDKTLVKVPYREVNWTDKKAEMAANIAANAHGGEFDTDKLAKLVEELEFENQFAVELMGLDPLTLRQLTAYDSSPTQKGGKEKKEESFQEYEKDSFEFAHCCPRCQFKFN